MTRRQRRLAGIAALLAGVTLAAVLMGIAFRKNLMNFHTPSDVVASTILPGTRMRLGGLVAPGSLRRLQGLEVQFVLADCEHQLPVRFEGILPDLFREGQGIVADGELAGDGVFVAEQVLAKHDENYMPPHLAESLEAGTGHRCDPFKPAGRPAA